jgi:hypothetical protein
LELQWLVSGLAFFTRFLTVLVNTLVVAWRFARLEAHVTHVLRACDVVREERQSIRNEMGDLAQRVARLEGSD